jgi:hypothetical protein
VSQVISFTQQVDQDGRRLTCKQVCRVLGWTLRQHGCFCSDSRLPGRWKTFGVTIDSTVLEFVRHERLA